MEDIHATVDQLLRRWRQRYTAVRRQLIELLATARRPLTIPEILAAGGRLSQSSTYRNLQVLEQAGAVHRIVTASDAGARFELAEHLTSHHHHLICSSCGTVEDFHPSSTLERALVRASAEAEQEGFSAEHHRLDLVGVCADCR